MHLRVPFRAMVGLRLICRSVRHFLQQKGSRCILSPPIIHLGALLTSNNVTVYSQRRSRVTVSQLSLHYSGSYTVCEQRTGNTMTNRMETTTRDTKPFKQGVKLLLA
jgi:hypothetical protein